MRSPLAKASRSSQRRRSALATLLLACALMLALGGAPAQAAPKGVVDIFGSAGTQGAQFNTPRGVAVRQSNGEIYVVDSANHRVQRFDAMAFVSAWGRDVVTGGGTGFETCTMAMTCKQGSTGPANPPDGPAGELSSPQGIAIDQADGSVYVTDQGNLRVQKFDEDGNFLLAFGKDVVTGGGTGFEVCTVAASCKQGAAINASLGALGGEFASTFSGHVAVSPVDGNVVVADPGNRRVQEFDSSGAFVRAWGFDVIQPGKPGNVPVNETQTVTVRATGGTFTLTFIGQTTAPIAFDASPAAVQTALEGLDNLNPGDVIVTGDAGGPWSVEFAGARADTDVAQMTGSSTNLRGRFRTVTVATAAQGAGTFEVCTVAADCKIGAAGGSGVGQFATSQPTRVAVDSSGFIYTVENTGNFRVQRFHPDAASRGIFARDHTSGTNSSTAPSDVAVDLTNDHVFVTKADNSSGVTERHVLELDIAGGLVETHAAGGGLPAVNGMAVDSSSDRIYLTPIAPQANRVFVLGEITPPSATIAPTTDVTATSATFHGTVNPNGGSRTTGYHFEYSDDGGLTWTSVPIPDEDVGSGITDVPVSEAVTGLEPNTDYRVRLVASRPFAGGSATSAVDTFTTPAAPPSISSVGAREISDTTAVLGGRVDPNHSQTTYQFEYGTDASYGNTTPVDSAGAGARSVSVSKAITGLQPSTEYHFRLVASNAAGATEGADHTFTTDADPPQPSGRAYEMVSPLDKNGGDIVRDLPDASPPLSFQTGAAGSGDVVAYISRANFGDLDTGAALFNTPNYLARRGDDGWITEGITPPVEDDFPGGSVQAPRVTGLSLDTSRSFGVSGALLTPEAERLGGSDGLYMRSAGQTADQRYTLISAPPDTLDPDTTASFEALRFTWEASTPDARHVVFNSTRRLLPGAPGDASGSSNAVYEWADGTLRLASVLPPGLSLSGNPTVIAGGGGPSVRNGALHGDHLISDDGRRLFFTADTSTAGASDVLFVREDGAETRIVSADERPCDPPEQPCDPPRPPRSSEFWAAKGTDGSVAFFTSSAPLTADAVIAPGGAPMLYRWDANAPEGQRLSAISPDPLGAPRVFGPAAVSDDATSVYFVAFGVLAQGATRGVPNLYLWRQGQGVRYVATLDPTGASINGGVDSSLWNLTWADNGGRGARISADGERLLFASYAQLDPSYDTTEESPDDCGDPEVAGERCRQIYLFDAPSGQVSCLTCVAGVPVDGDTNLFGNGDDRRPVAQRPVEAPLDLPRNLSADGRRAFFETARPLVAADENGAIDVYEWEDSDLDGQGELRLISSGRSATDSKFLDASASGDDVFFTTRDRLAGIDTDNQVDLYDARIGGGFAAQNPSAPPPPCEGDGCQGTPSGAPFLPGVGSDGTSHGDLRAGARPSFSVARLSRKQRAQLARGRQVQVRVRVNRAGKVRLAARAKLGRRMRTVDRASKTARRAGTLRLGLKLSRAALRELTRKRQLKVKLAVRFTGVREARSSTVSLRRAPGAGERRPR
jgi:NHL repeat